MPSRIMERLFSKPSTRIGEKVITYKGKKYGLATVRDARSFGNLEATRRKAQKWVGKGGKVLRIHNTYMFAVYKPIE